MNDGKRRHLFAARKRKFDPEGLMGATRQSGSKHGAESVRPVPAPLFVIASSTGHPLEGCYEIARSVVALFEVERWFNQLHFDQRRTAVV